MAVPVAPYAVGSGAGTPDNPWSQVTNPATGKTFYTPSDQVQAYYEQYSSLGYPTPAAPSQPAPSQESLWVTNPDLAYQLYQQGLPAALEDYDIQMPQPTAPGSALPGYIVQPTPAPTPQVIQQPVVVQEVTGSPLSIMAPFKTSDGYDLIAAMQAAVNEPQIRQVAMQYFEPEAVQYAEYAAKPALDVEQWAKLSPERQQFLRPVRDADIVEYSQMTDWEKLGVKNIVPMKMSKAEYKKLGERSKEFAYPEVTKLDVAREIALSAIPVYGTIRTWGQSSPAMKALGVVSDVLWIVPFVGGISAVVRLTPAQRSVGTAARTSAAIKAVKQMVIAEIKAPITAIAHPIRTGKAILEPIETALRPGKLPLAGMEIRYNTQRIPIIGSVADTAAVRTKIVDSMIARTGKTATGEYITATMEMPQALWQVGPAAIHNTPDIRPFLEGAEVTKDLYISPTVHGRFIWATSGGWRPVAGELTTNPYQGILLFRDPSILAQLTRGELKYGRMTEAEAKLSNIVLPRPTQTLMSRDLNGDKFSILVFGKPFSKTEIAQFKIVGAADTLRTIFKPSVQVTRTTNAKLLKLANLEDDLLDLQREEMALARAEGRAAELGVIRSRIAKLSVQVGRARADISQAISGRLQYVAVNTRAESVLSRPSATMPEARASVSVDRAIVNEELERVIPTAEAERIVPDISTRQPPEEILREVPPSAGERVPPEIPSREVPPGLLDRAVPPTRVTVVPEVPRVPPTTPVIQGAPPVPTLVPPKVDLEATSSREQIKTYEGAIGWQQGELKSGKVFHIYKKPWEQKDYEIVVADEPPEGMRLFPNATKAIETLQVLTGEFPGERDIDIGAFQLQIKGTRQLKGRYVRRGGNTPMADVSAKEAKVTVVS